MRPALLAVEAAAAVLAVTLVPPAEAASRADPAFVLADPRIDESSGLVDLGRTVLTVNDSGDGPVVYVVDTSTGRTVGVTTYSSGPVEDVEAVAPGPGGSVWVADIGDNRAHRTGVSVYRLPPVARGDRTVEAQRYDLVYRGGPRDAEALLVHPRTGRLYVVSKGLFGGRVYVAPPTLSPDRPNLLRPVGRTGGLVTDGAFFPDGRHAVLRSYSGAVVYDTRTWRPLVGLRLPAQRQGEGIAVRASGRRVLLSSEGERQPVLSMALPRKVLALVGPPQQPSPAPSTPTTPPSGDAAGPDAVGPGPGVRAAASGDGRAEPGEVLALAAVVLAAALAVRAGFRGARRRGRSRR